MRKNQKFRYLLNNLILIFCIVLISCKQKEDTSYVLINSLLSQDIKEFQHFSYDKTKNEYTTDTGLLAIHYLPALHGYENGIEDSISKNFPRGKTDTLYTQKRKENETLDTTKLSGFSFSREPNNEVRAGKKVIYFSYPIIENSLTMIEVDIHVFGNSKGYTYILEQRNNKWIIDKKLLRWIE